MKNFSSVPTDARCIRPGAAWRPFAALITALLLSPWPAVTQPVGNIELIELTISEAHQAMLAGTLTSRELVVAYLDRINAFDKRGPAFNATIMTNPRALARADELHTALQRTGAPTGPLHGIPFIVKDNYDTWDMPMTGGSASLEGSMPADDAYQVRNIREAGAIVLAKSNLAELAFTETADPETLIRFTEAIEDLRRAGAIVAGDFLIPNLDSLRQGLGCSRFRYDIDTSLASVPNPPVHSLQEIEEGGRVHVTVMPRVRNFLQFEGTPDTNESCIQACKNEELLREGVRAAMAEYNVEALVYPTWNNPPRLVGDLSNPHGNNSPILSPPTGFPAITVPMGFVWDDTLPAGLQIYGDAWSEPLLIRIAYTYEQATNHRRPPKTAPPLEG